jgi:CHAT domain-containing protein
VGERSTTGGVLPGDIYLDKDFTQARFHDVLDRAYPVIHIASHFQFIPGTESQSFLLLGDGKELTLAELRTGGWKFGSVDMMTLSACNTALGGDRSENGNEIEGFGALAQRQGAKGVLATLWPVADQSTAMLMQSLYRLRQEKGLTKADALREAQLMLISGKHAHPIALGIMPIVSSAGTGAVDAPTYKLEPAKPYAHPFYWAPFILMGNWL